MRSNRLPVIAAFALSILSAPAARAATPSMTRSDSLFAPVAAQQAERLAKLPKVDSAPTAADVARMLESGDPDRAAGALSRATGTQRALDRVRLRVALVRHDFAKAAPIARSIAARKDADDRERAALYDYLFAVDASSRVDSLTRAGTRAPERIAAGRLAYNLLQYDRAESSFTAALSVAASLSADDGRVTRAAALRGLGQVRYKRRDYDGALAKHTESIGLDAPPEGLLALSETLIQLGRTDEAITAAEWAVKLDPYSEGGHYTLGNGYARKNYTELAEAYPDAFADEAGRRALLDADTLLARGDAKGARTAYDAIAAAHPGWVDAHIRIASLDFAEGRYAEARDGCFESLRRCSDYGRAHATLAKALESQRFAVDVHRADYERRFAAAPMPSVPGIERFVVNWASLSPRHQKRVALSCAPWKQFIPVLVEGGSSFYIKPMYMLLSETPGLETLRDTRINYDSRLWDDVRGAGGYATVTGIEDVERTIFDRYNTVTHELTHQVHGVLTAEQSRVIQDLYRQAKTRDEQTKQGFLSRYAGGSVYEYFAEGANAIVSPKRDAWDPREVVSERLDEIDPPLRELVKADMALTDVSASYPIAYTNAGDDRVERGDAESALQFYSRALQRAPTESRALESRTRALVLGGKHDSALVAARRGLAAHPENGSLVAGAATAWWYAGRGLDSTLALLSRYRPGVLPKDRDQVDLRLGKLYWVKGDAAKAIAACDSALAAQSDLPEALWGKAAALALDQKWAPAFELYEQAVRARTGIVELRCDYARDLIRAGELDRAATQLAEAALLDKEHPTAEALRGWLSLERVRPDSARIHCRQALAWGPWSDLAGIILARAEGVLGDTQAAAAAEQPVRDRIARNAPPEYTYRTERAEWVSAHELPAVERALLKPPATAEQAGGR